MSGAISSELSSIGALAIRVIELVHVQAHKKSLVATHRTFMRVWPT